VAGGVYAKRDRISRALGTTIDKVVQKYLQGTSSPISAKIVETGAANGLVWEGDQVDLSKLPIVTHSARDAGAFVTAGVQVVKNPETGVRALGIDYSFDDPAGAVEAFLKIWPEVQAESAMAEVNLAFPIYRSALGDKKGLEIGRMDPEMASQTLNLLVEAGHVGTFDIEEAYTNQFLQ